jgi:predicted DNA-binding protein
MLRRYNFNLPADLMSRLKALVPQRAMSRVVATLIREKVEKLEEGASKKR